MGRHRQRDAPITGPHRRSPTPDGRGGGDTLRFRGGTQRPLCAGVPSPVRRERHGAQCTAAARDGPRHRGSGQREPRVVLQCRLKCNDLRRHLGNQRVAIGCPYAADLRRPTAGYRDRIETAPSPSKVGRKIGHCRLPEPDTHRGPYPSWYS